MRKKEPSKNDLVRVRPEVPRMQVLTDRVASIMVEKPHLRNTRDVYNIMREPDFIYKDITECSLVLTLAMVRARKTFEASLALQQTSP